MDLSPNNSGEDGCFDAVGYELGENVADGVHHNLLSSTEGLGDAFVCYFFWSNKSEPSEKSLPFNTLSDALAGGHCAGINDTDRKPTSPELGSESEGKSVDFIIIFWLSSIKKSHKCGKNQFILGQGCVRRKSQ